MREREFEFTAQDFERIRELIYRHAGISLHSGKTDMVYSRIARRLRATGLQTFDDYLALLHEHPEEWEQFVNSLTTNLTAFFREQHHFPILAELLTRLRERYRGLTLTLWSAACSTGEEPYSMAMTAIDAFGSWKPPVRILATDLDTNVLQRAAAGIYDATRVEQLAAADTQRFFLRGRGTRAGLVRVRPEIQSLVIFRQLNLLGGSWSVRAPLEAIFCRNVLIYFDKPTQYRLLARFRPLLRPDGLLFVGHSESLSHAADLFRARGKTVYAPVNRA